MIIFAHVNPPNYLFQARNFDVPLMVFVSGMSFFVSRHTNQNLTLNHSYLNYVWKRIKRLVIPVWIFLTFYFLFAFTFDTPIQRPDYSKILTSFSLQSGIGYVWIIRVFVLIAIFSPLIGALHGYSSDRKRYIAAFIVYFFYEFLYKASLIYPSNFDSFIITDILLFLLPFGTVFLLGMLALNLSKHTNLCISVGFFALFFLLFLYLYRETGKITPTQNHKYPPTIYYLSYSLGVCYFLWAYADKLLGFCNRVRSIKIILFVARNSIWIYLWHIPLIELTKLPFLSKYFVVFSIAIFITWTQIYFLRTLVLPRIESDRMRNNISLIFTG